MGDGTRTSSRPALLTWSAELRFFPSRTLFNSRSRRPARRQRRDLREVSEKVSRYFVVTARSVVSVHEIEALLDRIVGPNPEPSNTMDFLDWASPGPWEW